MVWNIALGITSDEASAEDAASEVFVKLFKKYNKFSGKSSLKTWIYRVAVNTVLNYVKKEKRRKTLNLKENLTYSSSTEKYENKDTVERILSELDEKNKTFIVLREMQGLSYKEISDILGMKIGTVKTNIYRAREKMKNIYIDKGYDGRE